MYTSKVDATIVQVSPGLFVDNTAPTTVEYNSLGRDLESMYTGETVTWPELNQEWKDWNYTSIANTATKSSRTMTAGSFSAKAADVIVQHTGLMSDVISGPVNDAETTKELQEGEAFVPFSYLTVDKSLTREELAGIAYEAFYLQTWNLVPAADQGVCIVTPDGAYTAEMILAMVE